MRKYTNVLVIEDDYTCVFLIKLLLRESDLVESISVADNGEEALTYMNLLKTNGSPYPELIFLDINMPIMDGFAFLEACKQTGCLEGEASKVIILTSSASQSDINKANELGVKDYLLKPVSEEAILASLGD
jgi:CheY-like chemotaxis protein